VKKSSQYTSHENTKATSTKDSSFDKIKTTNINILLNRVRLDKKKALQKKFFFSITLVIIVSFLAVYFVI
tara:strand:- start:114 stop:323 length:210 start_codon:yes stop_codon:yes gene_type:complete